jgi:DNA-binding GntR family transcriptional regulator
VRCMLSRVHVRPCTARKAVASLQDAGLVVSYRGWGTFVADQPPS